MPSSKQKPAHHHGNLRQALIDAGLELLEAGGPDALTLRKCAAKAGVSHAAPANHFAGLPSLKMAIIARGHVIFAGYMRDASEQADSAPSRQLHAICEGYIAFAREHQNLFRFMFQYLWPEDAELDETTREEKDEAGALSYEILQQACQPFEHRDDNPLNTETMVWSVVHGYAMLFCAGKDPTQPEQVLPLFSEILPVLKERDAGEAHADK